MMQFTPLTPGKYGRKALRRMDGYGFAATQALIPIVGAEFPNVARTMPIGFIKQETSYLPVALMSLDGERNVFVGTGGRWLGLYIPAAFRTYPFRLVQRQDADEWVFCIDEASPAIVEIGGEAQPFYDGEGNLSSTIKAVLDVLEKIERNRRTTTTAIAALAQASVLKPWDIELKAGEAQRSLAGLYCIDEAALNALADELFRALRKAEGVSLAYMQLLSMGHLDVLDRLARVHNHVGQPPVASPPKLFDTTFAMSTDDTLQF